jgi:hypothetical protein
LARIRFILAVDPRTLQSGAPMKKSDSIQSSGLGTPELDRRQLLRFAGVTGLTAAAIAQPRFAAAEIYEQGDEQCRVAEPAVKPVDLSENVLADFIAVSQALTGAPEVPRKRRLAGEYLERFAQLWDPTKTDIPNPGYFPKLLALHDRYKSLPDAPPDAKAAQLISDPNFTDAAQQVIYLWYVSAFFIEPPDNSIGAKPGTFKPGKTWIYGTADQYRQSLLWPLLRAHPPAMPQQGGGPGYWATAAKPFEA